MLECRLLGNIDVRVNGDRLDVGPARQRCVLVALLVDANEVVSVEQLMDRVWAERRPQRVHNALYGYMSRLRKALAGADGIALHHASAGYSVRVDPSSVDLHRFRALVRQGRAAADPAQAMRLFDEALGLWRGDAFANLDTPWLNTLRDALAGERFAAERDRVDIALELGVDAALLPDLAAQADQHPLDERVARQLMLVQYRSGRQADALDHYLRLRQRLADTLGVDPAPELQQMHLRIINNDPALAIRPAAGAAPTPAQPGQLPPAVGDFTGRQEAVHQIDSTLTGLSQGLPIAAVCGSAGVGKSSLALHAAHRLRPAFPDGQLYLDLRGAWPDPIEPLAALGRLLRALGLPDAAQAPTVEERSAQFRDAIAGRRMLVVLDDAASAAHVRLLLPGDPSCAVIVTSRRRLTGLEGARHLVLETFDPDEAVALLAGIVGPPRADLEGDALAEIANLCGYLPLAVRIAGSRLAGRPRWRVAHLAERLRDELARLNELATDDLEVRGSLGLSYRVLPEPAARLLRMVSLLDAPDLPVLVGAAMLDVALPVAEDQLELLTDFCLLEVADQTDGSTRYRMHDLVRLFARERAAAEDPVETRTAALRRAFGAWLAAAEEAGARLTTGTLTPICGPADRWLPREPARPDTEPVAWFEAERSALAASVRQAGALGMTDLAWNLAASAETFYELQGLYDEGIETHRSALAACRRAGDNLGAAVLLRNLADMWASRTGADLQDKLDAAEAALGHFQRLGERRGVVDALWLCADVHRVRGHHPRALTLLDEALALSAAEGYELGECHALAGMAVVAWEQGRPAATRELAERYAALAGRLGFRRDESVAMTLLGLTDPDPERGGAALREALAIARLAGDRVQETYALARLGMHAVPTDRAEARCMLEKALRRSRTDGLIFGEAVARWGIGELELAHGRPRAALIALADAIRLLGDQRFAYLRGRILTALGTAHARCDEPAAATAAWTAAGVLFAQIDNAAGAVTVDALQQTLRPES